MRARHGRAQVRPSPRLPPSGAMKPSALQLAARLCRALQNQDDAMVAALLQEGADPNLVLTEGVAAMHLAAGLEQENGTRRHLLRLLLQHGGDPNVRSGEGLTPLHVAASWGRTACLRLLLAEGGDPHLEDQDGSTAIDLAVEQGYERCVSILRDEKWNSSFSQRRAESFLSTITEDAGQTGAGDSPLCPSDGSSWKELRQCREPCGTFSQPGGAAPDGASGPCTQDRSASSFLTECSWQGDTVLDLSDFSLQPGDLPNASLPFGKPVLSGADVQALWDGEVGCRPLDTGVKRSWNIQGSVEGECSSPPAPDTAPCGPLSLVGTEALLFRPNMPHMAGSPQKTLPSVSLGTKSEPEAGQLHHLQDASTCDPSQRCPAPPWPQSALIGPLPHESISSSSLFEEPLELPKRPRRVRRGRGLASHREAAKPERSPPSAREAEEMEEEARAISALPRSRKPSLNSGPCSLGGEEPSGRTESKVEQPCQGDAAPDPPEAGHLENLGVRGSPGKRVEKISRVSFSRLSGRGPSAACSPGRLSPINQEVLLSPGGRPVSLSATEPVEYLYVDEEGGHSLVERHIPPTDNSGSSSSEDTILYDWQTHAAVGRLGNGVSAPLNPEHLTDEALARKLRELGADPGPVTPLTRKLYVRLLERLTRQPETPARKGSAAYSPELASALETYRIPNSRADEMALAAEFDRADKSRKWREGLLKASFNYLLLDPRVTQYLPARCQLLSPAECFRTFVHAIFYVGKGTRGRPYRHLYEALTHYRESQRGPARQVCSKVQHILEIWAGGRGVVSVHCFQNVVPVEAYTREACMVEALGLKMLTNQKKGNYYGQVAGWPMKRRRSLGVFLLHRTLQVFLGEGERQLRPADI